MIVRTLNNDEKSSKSIVIHILSAEKNLSLKQIFERAGGVNYSNLYKALDILINQGKIEKIEGKYSLNIEWVKELGRFSEKVQKIYSQEPILTLNDLKDDHSIKTLIFSNLAKADEFRKRLQLEYLQRRRKEPYIGIYNHLKSPIIDPELSLRILETLKENNIKSFLAISSDTRVDRWCAKFYSRNPNVRIKTGVSIPSSNICETMILGDVIVQMTIPKEIDNYLNRIYSSSKSIDDIDAVEFYEKVYKQEADVKIVILKNNSISQNMRNEVIKFFK